MNKFTLGELHLTILLLLVFLGFYGFLLFILVLTLTNEISGQQKILLDAATSVICPVLTGMVDLGAGVDMEPWVETVHMGKTLLEKIKLQRTEAMSV